jgi:multiple sugar transport system permease protein
MVIYLAGLKNIPKQLYEAADIDGANWWAKLINITLPMLTPTIFFNSVMGIIGSFQIFTQAYIMTQGGPVDSTLFYVYYLFNNAFAYFKMGYACSMAWILFIIILIFTLIQFRLSRYWVYYEMAPTRRW